MPITGAILAIYDIQCNRRAELRRAVRSRARTMRNKDILLIDAALAGDTRTVQELLARGADPNARDHRGGPSVLALVVGCEAKTAAEVLLTLLSAGADVNARDDVGRTALTWCTRPDLLDILWSAGVTLDSQDEQGETALMHAVRTADADIMGRLLERGADRSIRNEDGMSVSDIAAEMGMAWAQAILERV